uniref:fructose-bisphosphatase n=2 Tax=Chromera velia TaxID=505693 RepID=X2D8V6_9ALVE|nr:cytosolic fructose-1,6-bisphosphatase [Chromera velia]|mmetsp:Transcript_40948/g.80739  ORF Transcript_40948/g.80739 Transcript_40948/m.80739 type:complete len:379 (-) Transcript_40948:1540-2676(-)|eukprot:Cvel_26261.t1-p1 / transcript=Cvel_26261.t1 / gene=Cvel_26261 / organism=Chromera_velia_CCMP2878 / gene_product=Fructose-1,6-bisphosphatase class 1, putative / transcript_product=Fructose-1,6-bisphosphatase class 1, putative / location=Cvel_scaffold3097:8469-13080(+) / protein_length=378 / sequence_SO=supercontig / SO=protein_coding / is_pseudo=false
MPPAHTETAVEAKTVVELGEFIVREASRGELGLSKDIVGEINSIMTAIKLGAKVCNREISKANTFGIDVATHEEDMPTFANRRFLDALINREVVAGIATQSMDAFMSVENCQQKQLVCLLAPLDGTRQIDVNVSVGTLFSVYKRVSEPGAPVEKKDFLQPGCKQLVAGYIIYGSSTMIVVTFGRGVFGFTLDPSLGTFYLSHPNMKFPENGAIYSVNGGKRRKFPKGVVEYISHCQSKAMACRYIGSMVADFHRNFLKGGIYIYPPTFEDPKPSISMIFQCNPLAFICEQAGGKASDGFTRILAMEPTHLHNRVCFFCGSRKMVEEAESFMALKKMADGGWCYRRDEAGAESPVHSNSPSLPLNESVPMVSSKDRAKV